MAADARNHHYVPQAYLRGFTDNGSKNSNFVVYDVASGKRFETKPRNVCAERDFNRVNIPGIDPNIVETDMGKFEGLIPGAVQDIDRRNVFDGDSRNTVLNLIAILATRHPDRRAATRQFHARIAKITMSMVMAKAEAYDHACRSMEKDGSELPTPRIPYEQMKQFVDGGEYKIYVATEHHLTLEATAHQAALDCLAQRKWTLYRAVEGFFITSDFPVSLTWRNPEKVPMFYRSSPGHAMPDTEIVFPLNKHLVLIGTFDGTDGVQQASALLVGAVNRRVLDHARRHIYSAKRDFSAVDAECRVISGARLFDGQ